MVAKAKNNIYTFYFLFTRGKRSIRKVKENNNRYDDGNNPGKRN